MNSVLKCYPWNSNGVSIQRGVCWKDEIFPDSALNLKLENKWNFVQFEPYAALIV